MKITINKPTEFEAIYLKVDAGVRYWDDAEVNGVKDTVCDETNSAPTMPCTAYVECKHSKERQWRWQPLIDIDNGIIVNWKQGTTAVIHYKVCDDFKCDILDSNKDIIASYDGYVPEIMCPADVGYGDYIIMNIDEYGVILGWRNNLIYEIIEQNED